MVLLDYPQAPGRANDLSIRSIRTNANKLRCAKMEMVLQRAESPSILLSALRGGPKDRAYLHLCPSEGRRPEYSFLGTGQGQPHTSCIAQEYK